MPDRSQHDDHDTRGLALKAVLLTVMCVVSFGVCFFARDLSFVVMGWPVHFWIAAQGGLLVFIAIVVVYAVVMNRMEDQAELERSGLDDA